MNKTTSAFAKQAKKYKECLNRSITNEFLASAEILATCLRQAWIDRRQVFICGNGGSAANAIHIANDMHFGIGACGKSPRLPGLRIEALVANAGIMTCLANDVGYAHVFSHQLQVKGSEGDILIALSGSGNSQNIVEALKTAKKIGIKSFAIIAFDGGRCLNLADIPIYSNIEDMQVAEDLQLIVGHLCMQWLSKNKPDCVPSIHI